MLITLLLALSTQAALRIVVIEGEGAVNIIQQKTAVAPIVEVRDQNNVPVAGAVVRFAIAGNRAAFAGGSPTLTLTTNAAGQAAASAVSPLASGSVQIQVHAAFQGQTAVATITQTNVLTAAQAGAAAATGASGGGGGIGTGTIVGIAGGAAAAGAALVVTKSGDSDEGDDDTGGDATALDPAVQAALGVYTLQSVNGAGLPATTVASPPATCPVITDFATLTLSANNQERNYEVLERSRTNCSIGQNSTFQSSTTGSWSLSSGAVTFTARSDNFLLDVATLSGSTLTMTVRPPHIDAGREAPRVTTVWRK